MIEPMKKVAVLMSAASREPSLENLRRLGVMHLQPSELPSSPSTLVGEGDERLHLEENLRLLRDALALVSVGSAIPPHSPFSKWGSELLSAQSAAEGLALASELLALHYDLSHGASELAALRRQRDEQAVLGRFNPQDILTLREAGVFIRFYACSRRDWKTHSGRSGVERIAAKGSTVYLALISRNKPERLPLPEVALPDFSLDELEARIAASEQARADRQARFETLATQASRLCASQLYFRNALCLAQARARLGDDERVIGLQGFCPTARIAQLSAQAVKNGWGLVVTDPTDQDPVPTLLRNSRFAALFQPVMDFLRVLPGYREFDTNGVFLIFFTLFFAIILGDAGYGLLLFAATFAVSRRVPALPRPTIQLFYALAAATVVWGALNGLWFGVPQLAELPGLRNLVIPALNAFAVGNETTVIRLCLTLGAIHLTLAHLWAAGRRRSLQSLADLGWMLVTWAAWVAALQVLTGDGDLNVAGVLAVSGLAGVTLFGEQTGGGLACGVGRGVLNLPLNLLTAISSFSDMVSYLRLFAIGLATKEVAVAFNRLALEVGFDSVVAALGAALLVLLGHSVNLLLGALGVIVHGLRLNLLEFSRHLNVTWSGIPYDPFRLLTASDLDYERDSTSR